MNTDGDGYWACNLEKARKLARKQLRFYEEACEGYPSARLPEDFRHAVMGRLDRYVERLPRYPGGGRNVFNGLMPLLAMMAAVHVVLREAGWTPEQLGRLTYDAFLAKFRHTPAPARWVMRRVMVSPLLPFFTRGSNRAMRESGRDDTFFIDYSFDRQPSPRTRMNCSQCGMIEFMKRNDLAEMTVYCNVFDFAQAHACGMGLVQPTCLGAGDSTCQYRITRNPADTRLPDSVARILATPMFD